MMTVIIADKSNLSKDQQEGVLVSWLRKLTCDSSRLPQASAVYAAGANGSIEVKNQLIRAINFGLCQS